MAGITSAVRMVEQYGRGPDTMLAHISPDEAALIDHLQGGRRINPTTGLAEYGLFGKILKGVVRAGATLGAFIASGGNPAAAAAANAAATKLTGGSWKQAATGAALSGLGAGLGNMAGGVGFMGGGNAAGVASLAPHVASTGTAAGSTAGLGLAGQIGSMAAPIGGLGGLGAATGSLMSTPRDPMPQMDMTPPVPDAGIVHNRNAPPTREFVDPGNIDYANYGMRGEQAFYRPRVNVPGVGLAKGGRVGYAEGGEVNIWGVPPEETFIGKLRAQRKMPLEDQLHVTEDDPAWGFVGSMSGLKIPMAEKMSRQGGALKSRPGLKRIADALDSHQVEWEYDDMGGIRAFVETHHPSKGWFKQSKTFKENTSLKTLRDWLGYAKGGKVARAPSLGASRAVARSGISQAARMGTVRGPGDGQDDKIPAMLSDNEHVIDAGTVALAGNGSSDAGHRVIEKFKRDIRAKAGLKKPSTPPKRVRVPHG